MNSLQKLVNSKFLNFRSKKADVFQRVSDRHRLTPISPDDIAETNFRLEKIEEFASDMFNKITINANVIQDEERLLSRLKSVPHRLAKYELRLVKGIGEKKANDLLDFYGNLAEIYLASNEQISACIKGVGPKLAQRIHDRLSRL